MWAVFIIDMLLINISFCQFGLLPRTTQGIFGIVTMPFLHANIFHIISNTVPLLVLMSITAVFFKRDTLLVIGLIIVIGGILVFFLGRPSYHVGASGLVYGLAGFLVAFGIFKKKIVPLLISLFVALTYGVGMLVGLLPLFPGVSWEGHLFGAIAGVLTARVSSR